MKPEDIFGGDTSPAQPEKMSKVGRFPKRTVVIEIETDYPNAEGIAAIAARELHERFTSKPYYNCHTSIIKVEGDMKWTSSVVPDRVQRAK